MLNQLVMVGRLVKEPEIKEIEEGKKVCNITLGVQRNYKNAEGEYETDIIDIVLWNGIAENVNEWCHKGDLIGVKGRIQKLNSDIEIVAEKVTFLSSKKSEEKEEENGK